jgi:hypothetical protein
MTDLTLNKTDDQLNRWCNALLGSISLIALIGLLMIVPPQLSLSYFNFILYGSPDFPATMSEEGVRYTSLLYAFLGSVIIGWMILLAWIVHVPLRTGNRSAWNIIALSITLWFIIDSSVSVILGYWQNAVSNASLAILVMIPLAMIRSRLND